MKNILIVGHGGREHALAWKIRQSPKVNNVYCAPGNAGMDRIALTTPQDTPEELAAFADNNSIDITVVGPEAYLCEGIVDTFRERGLNIVGPTKAAAQLEASKMFAKHFMNRYGIPTAKHAAFEEAESAFAYIREQGTPLVVKADGLAAGKGVTVAQTEEEACSAVQQCFGGAFGEAGKQVVLEECLQGKEASIIALTDGDSILPLASSQDYKRIGEGDTGANTGGMGAISPAPVVTDDVWAQVRREVLNPFVYGCKQEGLDFRGVIYAGIIVQNNQAKVLEFNVRLGDPEAQAILPRLESDFVPALTAAEECRLSHENLIWADNTAVCVVMASDGYPGKYTKGHTIRGISKAEQKGGLVFHSGTVDSDGELLTAGGRVLSVTATANNISASRQRVYECVECINWEGAYFRKDIGC